MTSADREFGYGVAVTGIAGGLLVAVIFVLVAPTEEYRARVAFLLASGGIGPAVFVGATCAVSGSLLLAATGRRLISRASLVGVAVGSGSVSLALCSGWLPRSLPESTEPRSRYIVFGVVLFSGVALLLWNRRLVRKGR